MNLYECEYCLKKFKRESSLQKHSCKLMIRNKIMRTSLGISAYTSYTDWMRMRGFKIQDKSSFMESKFFVSFVKFTKFANSVALPGKEKYVKSMVDKDILPNNWCHSEIYKNYLDNFDKLFTPEEQAKITVETFIQLSKLFECDISEVLNRLAPSQLAKLIAAKKMSPWILLFAQSFHEYLQTQVSVDQRVLIETYIDTKVWAEHLKNNPGKAKKMQRYTKEMGI